MITGAAFVRWLLSYGLPFTVITMHYRYVICTEAIWPSILIEVHIRKNPERKSASSVTLFVAFFYFSLVVQFDAVHRQTRAC